MYRFQTLSKDQLVNAILCFADRIECGYCPCKEECLSIGIGDSCEDLIIKYLTREISSAERTGEWIWVQYDSNPELGNFHCSECNFIPACFNLARKHLNYCPNCGARMKGEE